MRTRSPLCRAFTIVAIPSLLLCAMTGYLWARSYRQVDELVTGYWAYRPHPNYPTFSDGWEFTACNEHGRLKLRLFLVGCVGKPGAQPARSPRDRKGPLTIGPTDYRLQDTNWSLAHARSVLLLPGVRYRSTPRERVASVPHPLVLAITALLPMGAMGMAMRRRKNMQAGFCGTCGYDLRASRLRCPECGMPI